MNTNEIAKKIIELSGGDENFQNVHNCMTRVRIKYKDESLVKKEEINELDGVLGVNNAETFQIIVGPGKSVKIQEEINRLIQSEISGDSQDTAEKEGFLKILSNIFVPLIPAIIASGFLQGINNVIVTNATVKATELGIKAVDDLSPVQVLLEQQHMLQVSTVLGILGNATFSFLAIFVGVTAAKQFKTDPILGAALGAATTLPALSILGLTPGQGGLFGIIFGIWLMSKVEKYLKKMIPDILDVVLTPTFTLLITGTAYLFILMPVAGFLSDYLITGIMYLINNTGIFGGFVLAAAFPSLIATGLHHGLSPIHMELINTTGSTPIFPVQIMSNAGLLGAGIALMLLTNDRKIKKIAEGCLPTTFLAVGEPTMYGLVIPSGYGFITASIGAGIGGALIRFFEVRASAFGAAGMSAIPLMADGKYLEYLICYGLSVISAFMLTYVYGKTRRKAA